MDNPAKYTIEQVGNRWVASNGTNHVEADGPDEALFQLLCGEIEADEGIASVEEGSRKRAADELEERLCHRATQLIRLAAMRAPAQILRNEIKLLGRVAEEFIGSAELEE